MTRTAVASRPAIGLLIALSVPWCLVLSGPAGIPVALLFNMLTVVGVLARHGAASMPAVPGSPGVHARLAVVACVALLSLVLSTLLPPLQAPDENAHSVRAAAIANGQFLPLPNSRAEPATDRIDASLSDYIDAWLKVPGDHAPGEAREASANTVAMEASNRDVGVFSSSAPYFPAAYAPAAVGIQAAEALDQPIRIWLAWGRLGMWAIAMLTLAAALLSTRVGLHTMAALAVLPVTLQQVGTINLDAVTIPMAFLVVASLSNGAFGVSPGGAPSNAPITVRVCAWGALWLLCLSKPLFLTLLAPIGWWMLRGHWRALLPPTLMVVVTCLAWNAHVSLGFVDARIDIGAGPVPRLLHAATQPSALLATLGHSIDAMTEFYAQSMVGTLGWFDVTLPPGTLALGLWLVAIAFVADMTSANPLSTGERAACIIALLVYSLGTMLLMWAAWTPDGTPFVVGVQGRYFTPMLPLVAAALGIGRRCPRASSIASVVFLLLLGVAVATFAMDTSNLVLERYWR